MSLSFMYDKPKVAEESKEEGKEEYESKRTRISAFFAHISNDWSFVFCAFLKLLIICVSRIFKIVDHLCFFIFLQFWKCPTCYRLKIHFPPSYVAILKLIILFFSHVAILKMIIFFLRCHFFRIQVYVAEKGAEGIFRQGGPQHCRQSFRHQGLNFFSFTTTTNNNNTNNSPNHNES